jgi:hypothetical protein
VTFVIRTMSTARRTRTRHDEVEVGIDDKPRESAPGLYSIDRMIERPTAGIRHGVIKASVLVMLRNRINQPSS